MIESILTYLQYTKTPTIRCSHAEILLLTYRTLLRAEIHVKTAKKYKPPIITGHWTFYLGYPIQEDNIGPLVFVFKKPFKASEDFNITTDEIPFSSPESTDILTLLSRILQIGDAVWFSVERRAFKNHLFNIFLTENNSGVYSKTISVTVSRDVMFYISEYGGKLSALSGVVVPAIGFILSFIGL